MGKQKATKPAVPVAMIGRPSVAYLGLGSNLGDRLALLRAAVGELERAGVRVVGKSPVFETDAVADAPQPPYLNAVLRVETRLPARALLDLVLSIERTHGRERPVGIARAPRTLDIDVLLYNDRVIDEPGLRVPHPGLLERGFVLVPLALAAAPGLRHPTTGAALDACASDPSVRAFGGAL